VSSTINQHLCVLQILSESFCKTRCYVYIMYTLLLVAYCEPYHGMHGGVQRPRASCTNAAVNTTYVV
jgi:hypothetical protein